MFHVHEDFEAKCGLRGDLYDVVGHMKLLNGQSFIERPVLDKVKITTTRQSLDHIQTKEGGCNNILQEFYSHCRTPFVLLVTTVNTKLLGGTLSLSSMSSSRVLMNRDVQPTQDYLNWLGCNPYIANLVNAEEYLCCATMAVGEIFDYMKHGSAKVNLQL
ncbi:unnamed protein product [Brassica oleracea]